MNSPIPEKIGRFEITKVLGQGGMGVVYLGRDSGTEREVAVKTVKVDAPEDIKQRLRIEGKAGRLDHENIVTVFETGQWNGDVPYIAMQYVPGESLDKLVASRTPLTLLEKLDTIRQVCDGLDYAHLNGVVHRDIKPGNVIRRHDGMVKIVDFGIARVQTNRATTAMTGPLQVIGTLAYMAPERLRGERGDGRVDIFATGVLLYYLLTGEEPFTGEASSVMHKLVSEPHPPLSLRLAGYPTMLDQILDRALAKYPEDRYSTAQEFSADLAAVIDELNRGRIAGLIVDCKRLVDEGAFRAAADKAQQILRIDPQNSVARELRRSAQRGLDRKAIEERLRELQVEVAEAIVQKRYEDAIRALEEASRRAPGDAGLKDQLEEIRKKRNLQLQKDALCSDARTMQSSGDLTGAIQRYERALGFDPDDVLLLEELTELKRVVREQEERERAERYIANAQKDLAAQRFTDAIATLEGLLKAQIVHPQLDPLYRQALEGKRNQDTERRRDQVITQVRRLRIDRRYSEALSEIDHAPEELRSDTMLLKLKRELERDAENSRLAAWIAETVDHVLNEALTSLNAALSTLREAMQKLPGEDRFESLEADLLRRKQEFSNQQRRATCLGEAGEALHAGSPERAIKLIEYYLLEFSTDAEIDGLLLEAHQLMDAQRLRARLSECTAQGRGLLDQGKFTQAIAFLRPLVDETQNRGLANLLEQAEKGKAEADGRIRLVAKRVAELRHEGNLGEAIALIESQPTGMLQSSLLHEVLPKLREEEKQRQEEQKRQEEEQKRIADKVREAEAREQALELAIEKSRRLMEQGNWQRMLEPLETMQRVYGDSEALRQAIKVAERDRTAAADTNVTSALEEVKAALLGEDREKAGQTLRQTSGAVPYASTGFKEEWARLEKLLAAKVVRTLAASPVREVTGAKRQEPSIGREKTVFGRKVPLFATAAGAIALVAAVGGGAWKMSSKPAPETPNHTTEVGPQIPSGPLTDAGSNQQTDGARVDPKVVSQPTASIAPVMPPPIMPKSGTPPILTPAKPVTQSGSIPPAKPALGGTATAPRTGGGGPITPTVTPANPGVTSSNGGSSGSSQTVANPPVIVAKADTPPVIAVNKLAVTLPLAKPDPAALKQALGAFQSVFMKASTRNPKECKAALSGLRPFGSDKPSTDLQRWCEDKPVFQAVSNCSGAPEGDDKAATWSCTETISIAPKEGPASSAIYRGEARFSKSSDGPWQFRTWQLHE